MTLEEHARAIEAAIKAAYADGYELDNGDCSPIHAMDLNTVNDGWLGRYVEIDLPEPTYSRGAM
ncbi:MULTISPECIES: hypothetical protein [Streptomycetaceae]|uniref:hypothetical protein n=1 Tax=Streptomycetaceae TaxID=2062 RepID=UPI000D0AB5B5|nr:MULTISPECIES: hypothetical protein [Streptomycetaceae]MYS58695.1 hypothetical protein [Streptomyces sp. SID5468]